MDSINRNGDSYTVGVLRNVGGTRTCSFGSDKNDHPVDLRGFWDPFWVGANKLCEPKQPWNQTNSLMGMIHKYSKYGTFVQSQIEHLAQGGVATHVENYHWCNILGMGDAKIVTQKKTYFSI